MPNTIKTKQTFGSGEVTAIRPAIPDHKVVNIIISFEEALKLHLSLGQALAKLNSYNRATTAGKRSAVNVCLHNDLKRIAILEAQLPKSN